MMLQEIDKGNMMKSVLITGCSSGIGLDTALQMHSLGWKVFASCRKEEDVARLQALGLETLVLDVDKSEQIKAAFEAISAQTGGTLDALFCNAGYGQTGAIEDVPREALREQFETNVFVTWECIHHAMKIFRHQGHGRILVNSSILGFAAMPWRGAYNSTKFALEGMCDTLRHELFNTNIQVVLVEPGPVATRFRPNAVVKLHQHIDIENSVHRESYHKQLERLQTQGDTTVFTISSATCASICVHALSTPHPRRRYLVTVPTILFWYLKRLFPTALFDKLLRKI